MTVEKTAFTDRFIKYSSYVKSWSRHRQSPTVHDEVYLAIPPSQSAKYSRGLRCLILALWSMQAVRVNSQISRMCREYSWLFSPIHRKGAAAHHILCYHSEPIDVKYGIEYCVARSHDVPLSEGRSPRWWSWQLNDVLTGSRRHLIFHGGDGLILNNAGITGKTCRVYTGVLWTVTTRRSEYQDAIPPHRLPS